MTDDLLDFKCINAEKYDDTDGFDLFPDCQAESMRDGAITIFHTNIRSFNKNFDELTVILNNYKIKFNIIVLTETWVDEANVVACLEGYDVFLNKKSRNQNDGVIVFVRKGLAVGCEEIHLHGATCLKIDMKLNGERHCVLAVYRRPSSAGDLDHFVQDLESYCLSKKTDRTNWIVGDINCCILPETTDPLSQHYQDVLCGTGFVSCISVPTRVTSTSKSCIDHIFTDYGDTDIVRSGVIMSELTDHYFIVAGIDPLSRVEVSNGIPQNFTIIDKAKVSSLISEHDWTSIKQFNNVNSASVTFIETLKKIHKHIQKRKNCFC
ncbi:uncharacterized protein LOC120351901 [Nilaparvata lugens]|uniref:uncharacterized protein LOC120351901 n=1 Tax=Nilaparvata lugens TaxID=108931 RepID=UPI00193E48EF|nr:uncharacterized protein LOC120351901 [Nilaparvata lugens]